MGEGRPRRVGMGEIVAGHHDEQPDGLAIRGLGSCVAVFLHEPRLGLGGLAHILLPEPLPRSPLTEAGRFAPTAVAALIDALVRRGARPGRLRAKLAGGACMFPSPNGSRLALGERNVRATLEALSQAGIPVDGADVGGTRGRTVVADIGSGTFTVTSLDGSARTF